jgi:palmitoyltransferase ZDHHC9/14/18
VATYNVKMLAGTTLHTPTKYLQKHIDNVLHDEQVQEQLEAEQQREATADSEHAEQGKNADDGEEKQPGRRSTRRRASIPTYNLTMLAGTAVHIPTKYLEKHTANVMRDREISSSMLAANDDDLKGLSPKKVDQDDSAHLPTDQLAQELRDRIRFSKLPKSRKLLFEATHNAMTSASSSLGKRSRDMLESGKGKLQSLRTTRRTQSDGNLLQAAKRKRLSTASTKELDNDSEEESEDEKQYFTPQMKKWLGQGLYIGQHRDFDARLTETQNKAKRKAAAKQENKILPMPMFAGERLLSVPFKDGRDFKLPFDVYSPLPRKAKPEDWKKTSRSETRTKSQMASSVCSG